MEKPGRHAFTQDGDLHHQCKAYGHPRALEVMHWKDSITLVVFLPQTHNLYLFRRNIRRAQTRIFLKINNPYPLNVSRSWKTKTGNLSQVEAGSGDVTGKDHVGGAWVRQRTVVGQQWNVRGFWTRAHHSASQGSFPAFGNYAMFRFVWDINI